jgi:L-arabinose isomerase
MTRSRRPRCGLVLFRSLRFEGIGKETRDGPYEARLEREARNLIDRLSTDLDIVYPGMVTSRAEVIQVIKTLVNEQVDCVITGFMSWSEDSGWMRFLRDMPEIPTLFYLPTSRDVGLEDGESSDFLVRFVTGSQLVGALQGGVSIKRMGRRFRVVVDDGSQEALRRISVFGLASKANTVLRAARIGLLQSFNEVMWSTYVDPLEFFAQVGPELTFVSFDVLKEAIDAVADTHVEQYVAGLKDRYQVLGSVDEKKLFESARASIAVANLARTMALDAVVVNDVDRELHRKIGLRPGFYHSSFNEDSSILAPEGDVGVATLMLALRVMTDRHVNLVEPFYLDVENSSFAAGHHGVTDHTDERFRENVVISPDVRYEDAPFKYAGAPFAWYRYPPGVTTLAHFSECGGNYRIVSSVARSMPGEHVLPGYSHSIFKVEGRVDRLFEDIITAGTTQHFAAVGGDVTRELAELAFVAGFEHLEV